MDNKRDNPKRFDDWIKIDCEQCERWWQNQCDGVCEGENRPCNSFLATRSVILPSQIKRLQSEIKHLKIGVCLLCVAIIILTLLLM